jgi:hypothetical protein
MKKFLIVLGFILFMLPSHSAIITGEIEYNAENAEEIVFSKPVESVNFVKIQLNLIDNNLTENLFCLLEGKTELADRKIANFSDGTYGIMYYNDPLYTWYYKNNGRLISFTYKDSASYPARVTRYRADGSVINTGLKVSDRESFIYSPEGILLAHWVGELCYDKNNTVIMRRKYN